MLIRSAACHGSRSESDFVYRLCTVLNIHCASLKHSRKRNTRLPGVVPLVCFQAGGVGVSKRLRLLLLFILFDILLNVVCLHYLTEIQLLFGRECF